MKKIIFLLVFFCQIGYMYNLIYAEKLDYGDMEKYATDGNKATIWKKENVNEGSVTFEFNELKSIDGYALVASGTEGPLSAPTSWKLEGIAGEGSAPVLLDSREHITFNQINQRRHFFLDADKAKETYRKFKFTLKNEYVDSKTTSFFKQIFSGGHKPNQIQLSDIELFSPTDTVRRLDDTFKIISPDPQTDEKGFKKWEEVKNVLPRLEDDLKVITRTIKGLLMVEGSEKYFKRDITIDFRSPKNEVENNYVGWVWKNGFFDNKEVAEAHVVINLDSVLERSDEKYDDLIGVLYHELTHVFGKYEINEKTDEITEKSKMTEGDSFIEGLANAVEMKVGYGYLGLRKYSFKEAKKVWPKDEFHWSKGYAPNAWFLIWLDEEKSPGFMKKVYEYFTEDDEKVKLDEFFNREFSDYLPQNGRVVEQVFNSYLSSF